MDDKSIRGQHKNPTSNTEDFSYINALVRNVCLNGDSFDKYERMLEKKYPGKGYTTLCQEFVFKVNDIKARQSFLQSDLEHLKDLGDRLHLSEDSLSLVIDDLHASIKDESIVTPEEGPSDKKPISKFVLAALLALLCLAIIALCLFFARSNRSGNEKEVVYVYDTLYVPQLDTVNKVLRDEIVDETLLKEQRDKEAALDTHHEVDTIIVKDALPNGFGLSIQQSRQSSETKKESGETVYAQDRLDNELIESQAGKEGISENGESEVSNSTTSKSPLLMNREKYLPIAEAGDLDAQYMLGHYYNSSDDKNKVYKDREKARTWLSKAAERGHVNAQEELATMEYELKNYSNAYKWYDSAAKQGSSKAQFGLGNCYAAGHGVDENKKEAIEWYKRSANNGNCDAQMELGYIYRSGYVNGKKVVGKDYPAAISWFSKVVSNSASDFKASLHKYHAADLIGDMYSSGGHGIKRDYLEAVNWYKQSYELGNNYDSPVKLAELYVTGGNGLEKNDAEAVKWLERSHEKYKTKYLLAEMYEQGRGGLRIDYDKAAQLFFESTDLSWSLSELKGTLYTSDSERTRRLLSKFSERDAEAFYRIGNIYENGGYGLEPNKEVSETYYLLAKALGNSKAKKALKMN